MSQKNLGPKMWVVLPIGWQYNDEYYSQEGYAGTEACFTLPETAQEYANMKNVEMFRANCGDSWIGGYLSYENGAVFTGFKDLYEKGGFDCDDARFVRGKNLSDDEVIRIMEELELNFYEVIPTKIVC